MALFHYTGTETLFKIIESQTFHATHWKYLNDGSEMEAVKPLLHQIYAREFEQEGNSMLASGTLSSDLIKKYGRRIFADEADRMIDVAYDVTSRVMPVFVASLCRHDEGSTEAKDGLLSQWRGYGLDGGCAIEIDEAKLRSMVANEAKKYACMHVSIDDVEYDNHERILQQINVDGLATSMMRKLSGDESAENNAALKQGMHGFAVAIAGIAPKLKHPAFSEERETRIFLPCMSPQAAKEYPKRKVKQVKFRFRAGLPIPYVEMFEGKKPLPIVRVIVGPQRRQSDVAYAIGIALKSKNIKAKIELSAIPLVQ